MKFFAIAVLLTAVPAGAQLCEQPEYRDLWCMRLLPTAGFDSVVAHVALSRAPGPFTVTMTADGRMVYAPIATIQGLPPNHTYVAWAMPPATVPRERLGVVANGTTTQLQPIAMDPFVVLVTEEPGGRIVLQGQSPSSRLSPADFLRFALGASNDSMPMRMPMGDSTQWTMIPMPAGLAMLPSEMALRPTIAPWLPRADSAPEPRPSQVTPLHKGDTLHLTAGPVRRRIAGHEVITYAYNGEFPGPRIVVHQGDSIIVDFTNHLDQPSSIHWHGIRLDYRYDGVDPVPPGGHFVYHLRFPDAGVYWYHPHVREDMEQNLGLFGNIVVGTQDDEFAILDDVLVGDNGLVPYGRDAATHALMGRFGNVSTRHHFTVKRGQVVQFAFTNVANARVFNLSFPGTRMKIIGSDAGRFEHEEWVPSVVIAPAERYIVQARFERPGKIPLVSRVLGLDHLYGRFVPFDDTLGVVHVTSPGVATGQSFNTLHAGNDLERYRRFVDRPPDRTLDLTVETHDLPFVTRQLMRLDSSYFAPVEWVGSMPNMNWASTTDQVRWILRDPATGRENMDIGWTFKRDTLIKLRLVNDRGTLHGMQHPIHAHGQRFLVLAVNGVASQNLVWKDTVLVPAGGTVDILLDLSNPGRWMLHCHIAEHLTAGMMTSFTVQ
ncbi:MAG TPA: multicopper oxidase domain-containing protein [Gemmatimonadaceae bacterium]|jgi:suppressor of ftsI|nr:multicopper oxidase domain-containing protein [Gemmatimonadaceae bacterium]